MSLLVRNTLLAITGVAGYEDWVYCLGLSPADRLVGVGTANLRFRGGFIVQAGPPRTVIGSYDPLARFGEG